MFLGLHLHKEAIAWWVVDKHLSYLFTSSKTSTLQVKILKFKVVIQNGNWLKQDHIADRESKDLNLNLYDPKNLISLYILIYLDYWYKADFLERGT